MSRFRKLRVNMRMLVAGAAIGLPVFWFTSAFVEQVVYGGVHRHDGWTEADLKALGNFPFNKETGTIDQVPSKYRALDGQRVVLTGFMYSNTGAGDRVHDFEFVYNIQQCCFGGPPKVQERVFARCPDHKAVTFASDLRRLTGILHVKLDRDAEGVVSSVYTMDVEKSERVKGGFWGLFD
ncbi:MAG: hypothetical protein JWP03_935 [Phycisphaerales bacterium]|nr:hypothetical protein [Phycisphaerales bacterium]